MDMTEITDSYMREQMGRTNPYSLVVLKPGPNYGTEGSERIVWEHGRRNFQLRADGLLSIVVPVRESPELCGIGIFDTTTDEATEIMSGDPGVQAGIFTFDVHQVRSFPGDALP
ncbi:hypothetical protein GCM10029964_016060 [Kibdelosporangium lantanae]